MDAADVINGARSLDPSFSPHRHPNRVCFEFLTRYQRTLVGKVLARDSRVISSEITYPWPLASFEDGLELESAPASGEPLQYDRLHGIDLEYANGDRIPVGIIPWKGRAYADEWPVAAQREDTLIFLGRESNYARFEGIHIEYTPTPGVVSALDTPLVFPDNALTCLQLQLGGELCKRDVDACQRKTLPAEGQAAEEDWLDLIDERNDVEIGRVRRVFSR